MFPHALRQSAPDDHADLLCRKCQANHVKNVSYVRMYISKNGAGNKHQYASM